MNKSTIQRLIRHPDAERAAETLNYLSEGLFDWVMRERAIEAAVFWRNEVDRIQRQLNSVRSMVLAQALELVRATNRE